MRPSKSRNQTYINNARIIQHLQTVAEKNNLNRFVTLSFVYSCFGSPLNKSDVLTISRLMRAYFIKVSQKLNGRPRKADKHSRQLVPAIGFPEYRSKSNESGHLHYHTLINVPDDQLAFFDEVTKTFWKQATKNITGCPPVIDNRCAFDPKGATYYSNKFFEDGFTLENTVYFGISLT